MKNAVIAPSTSRISQNSVEASRNASLAAPVLEVLGEDRHERRAERGVGEQPAHEVRDLEGDREARRAARPEVARGDDLADEPRDPREPRGDREDRGVAGDACRPVAVGGDAAWPGACRRSLVAVPARSSPRADATGAAASAASRRSPRRGPRARYTAPSSMANIHSQKKRILRSERERLENRRYTSTIKTYFRRLQAAVAGGDDAAADAEHRKLVSTIDKAVKRGALHRNTGARKKSRAARVRAGASSERRRRRPAPSASRSAPFSRRSRITASAAPRCPPSSSLPPRVRQLERGHRLERARAARRRRSPAPP